MPAFESGLSVEQSANATVPLVAEVCARTSGEFDRVIVRAVASDHTREQIVEATGRRLKVPFWGMRAGRSYEVSLGLVGASETVWSGAVAYRTPKLPDALPRIRTTIARPAAMEPGVILFPAIRYTDDESGHDHDVSVLMVVDAEGVVVWYYQDTAGSIDDARMLDNGNLLFNRGPLEFVEMSLDGEIHGRWVATGTVPKLAHGVKAALRSTSVDVDAFHHEIYPLDENTFLALTANLREVEGFPTSEDDPNAPTETANVVDDVIVEMGRDGEIQSRISLLDALIPTRIGYGSLLPFWDELYRNADGGTRDWGHTNAVIHDPRDDTLIASVRHQDAIVKVKRGTGELVWILGVDEDWGELSSRVLRPVGDTTIPFHTHAPAITPRGTLMVYDNGNYRARPYRDRVAATDNRSRAVEYRIDEANGTFEEVWAFEGDPSAAFYTPYVGDTDVLPRTGNVLVTQGGICEIDGQVTDETFSGHHRSAIWEVTGDAEPRVVFHLLVGEMDQGTAGWYVYRSEKLTRW